MKLRIKGNSIRLRLSKSDVSTLTLDGRIEEHVDFGTNQLYYSLEKSAASQMLATYQDNNITVHIPSTLIDDWENNEHTGFSEDVQLTETSRLFILVEKDFVCLDETTEDQSDNYSNPKLNC